MAMPLGACDTCMGPAYGHDVPMPPALRLCEVCARTLIEHERHHSDGTIDGEATMRAGGAEVWAGMTDGERRSWRSMVAAGRIAQVRLGRAAR